MFFFSFSAPTRERETGVGHREGHQQRPTAVSALAVDVCGGDGDRQFQIGRIFRTYCTVLYVCSARVYCVMARESYDIVSYISLL